MTDEIAVALGISQGRSPGNDPFGGGQFGATPPGYPSTGNEGTQMAAARPAIHLASRPTRAAAAIRSHPRRVSAVPASPARRSSRPRRATARVTDRRVAALAAGLRAGLAALVRLRLAASASPGYPASPPSPAAIRVSRPIRSLAALAARPGSQAVSRPAGLRRRSAARLRRAAWPAGFTWGLDAWSLQRRPWRRLRRPAGFRWRQEGPVHRRRHRGRRS